MSQNHVVHLSGKLENRLAADRCPARVVTRSEVTVAAPYMRARACHSLAPAQSRFPLYPLPPLSSLSLYVSAAGSHADQHLGGGGSQWAVAIMQAADSSGGAPVPRNHSLIRQWPARGDHTAYC